MNWAHPGRKGAERLDNHQSMVGTFQMSGKFGTYQPNSLNKHTGDRQFSHWIYGWIVVYDESFRIKVFARWVVQLLSLVYLSPKMALFD